MSTRCVRNYERTRQGLDHRSRPSHHNRFRICPAHAAKDSCHWRRDLHRTCERQIRGLVVTWTTVSLPLSFFSVQPNELRAKRLEVHTTIGFRILEYQLGWRIATEYFGYTQRNQTLVTELLYVGHIRECDGFPVPKAFADLPNRTGSHHAAKNQCATRREGSTRQNNRGTFHEKTLRLITTEFQVGFRYSAYKHLTTFGISIAIDFV